MTGLFDHMLGGGDDGDVVVGRGVDQLQIPHDVSVLAFWLAALISSLPSTNFFCTLVILDALSYKRFPWELGIGAKDFEYAFAAPWVLRHWGA